MLINCFFILGLVWWIIKNKIKIWKKEFYIFLDINECIVLNLCGYKYIRILIWLWFNK